ncbi:hypothetical protein [Aquisphaera insulae]|uniref:hypothetical protein n=1 Tax=Aquisphaera insulae TaxID=2712864 RepID=UPI0013EA2F98|nr:hypothetical protein [Aquisphaera insulae]
MNAHRANPDEKFGLERDEMPPPHPEKPRWRWRRLTALEWATIFGIVGFLAGLLIPGSDHDFSPRFPPAPAPDAPKSCGEIAGRYLDGGSHGGGGDLNILEDGRYSLVRSACVGVLDRDSGWARRVGQHLLLSPAGSAPKRIERTFFSVDWSGRSYLVPVDRMDDFCVAVIEGDEPRDDLRGRFFLRLGDEEKRIDGVPTLSEPWAAYLRDNLLIGTISSAQLDPQRVTIDLGSEGGVERDDVFMVQGHREGGWRRGLRVVAVAGRSSEAAEIRDRPSQQPLEPGWKVVAWKKPKADAGADSAR